jgi:hypothetical protein
VSGRGVYAYADENPISNTDPLGLTTLAFGVQLSGNFVAMEDYSFQIALSWNKESLLDLSQWRLGFIGSAIPLTGVSTGIGASVGGLFTYSSANCVEQLNGWSGNFGGSAGVGLVGGFDVGNVSPGSPKTYNFFGGVGVEVSPEFAALPFEGHAAAAYTAAHSLSIARIIRRW